MKKLISFVHNFWKNTIYPFLFPTYSIAVRIKEDGTHFEVSADDLETLSHKVVAQLYAKTHYDLPANQFTLALLETYQPKTWIPMHLVGQTDSNCIWGTLIWRIKENHERIPVCLKSIEGRIIQKVFDKHTKSMVKS